jgi:hypothetical protein
MKWHHILSIILAALLLVYPLSMGPAYASYLRRGTPTQIQIKQYYAPLIWVTDVIPPLADLMEWYLRLWDWRLWR